MRNNDESKTERRSNTALLSVLALLIALCAAAYWYWA